jgi:hypothetical protein
MRRPFAASLAAALLLAAPAAWADRVALLPLRGGADPAPRGFVEKALAAMGHTLVPAPEVAAAVKSKVVDGVADTQEEYRAVGAATRADWVIVGSVEPAVTTERVELTACLVKAGRVESVAREVEKARDERQIREMVLVLVRAEGIGSGALPWERIDPAKAPPLPEPKAPPAPEVPEAPAVEGRARVAYPAGSSGEVWPPYTGGRRAFLGLTSGFSLPVLRPSVPAGAKLPLGLAYVGALRGGYAAGDRGLELFAELGGNLAGPGGLWLAGGARWMFAPAMKRGADGVRAGAPFYLGPELLAGGFFQLGTSKLTTDLQSYSTAGSARAVVGASLDLAYAIAPFLQLEADLGNLRVIPGGGGVLITVGATLAAVVRF